MTVHIFCLPMAGILLLFHPPVHVDHHSPLTIHALNCLLGGFPSIRHDGIRDFTAKLMQEVCRHVVVEPMLQSLSGKTLHPTSAITSDAARLDVKADGFWDCGQQSAFLIPLHIAVTTNYSLTAIDVTNKR